MNQFDFSADPPATTQAEDYFQRYSFASRIAQVLLNRRESSSLTLGVYGAWGEGKTSVMHFIEQELAAHSDAMSSTLTRGASPMSHRCCWPSSPRWPSASSR